MCSSVNNGFATFVKEKFPVSIPACTKAEFGMEI